jgi:hypothetical protein
MRELRRRRSPLGIRSRRTSSKKRTRRRCRTCSSLKLPLSQENAKHLYLDSNQAEGVAPGSVVQTDAGGQLAWETVIGRLKEFDCEEKHDGLP